ncbi:hypothetical protein [Frankia sp. QA3]|uniref:hypothetical protein n=1 Tax=Frankia sp. QA3 TaxID=710111 RepID=UPI000269CDA7|nr:hypothetical protein [Frankia sp. QA3]EIV96578.1 hypothetical protein FraQA3DRAFT_6482 [Frankia sp. QA3]
MANLIRALDTHVPVEYAVFHLVGLGDPDGLGDHDEPMLPETVLARHTQVHVRSAASQHLPAVRLEAWDAEPAPPAPPDGIPAWDYTEDLRLVSPTGIAHLVTLNGTLVRGLPVGPPLFRYGVRLRRAGGAAASTLPQFSDARGVETYLVQTWPLEDVFNAWEYLRPAGGVAGPAGGDDEGGQGGYEPSAAADWPSMRRPDAGTDRRTARVARPPRTAHDQPRSTDPGFRDLSQVTPEEFARIIGLPAPTRSAAPPTVTVRSGDPEDRRRIPGVIYNILPGPPEELLETHPELARHPEPPPPDFLTWPEDQRRELITRRRDDVAVLDALATPTEPRRTLQHADFAASPDRASPGMALRAWLWLDPGELDTVRTGALRTGFTTVTRDALSGRVFVSAIVTVLLTSASGITVRAASTVEAARLLAAERAHSPAR